MARSTYRPTKAMQAEGQRALDWIAAGKAGDGFTDTGRARAAQLARGEALSLDVVLRMYSYLRRHEVDKQGRGFDPGDDNYPSPGRVAWAAWGGDAGLEWSSRIRDEAGQASSIGDSVNEKRDLPPSYRPSASEDVPVFRPACASCQYFCLTVDPVTQQPAAMCKRWEAPVAADSYCDAWEACEDELPVWLSDDEDEDDDAPMAGMYAAAPSVEARAIALEMPLSDALGALLVDVFNFYTRAHEAHWNVAGTDFAEYHALFGQIYDDVHDSVDGIAENMRKIGSLAPALVVAARDVSQTDARALATELLAMNDTLLPMIRAAFDKATAVGEQGVANFLAERQDAHAMWGWQLRSSLGIAELREAPARTWTPEMEARWQELRGAAPEIDLEARRGAIAGADRRTFSTEVRAAKQSDGTVRMSGYAAMWDREADGLPFREVIKRGAFADSLGRGDDVFLLVNHNTDALPLARRSAGTLSVSEDETGLFIEAVLDTRSPSAADLAVALETGAVDKMSFAFRVAADGSTKTEDGVRELRALDLFEVSVVTWPAYNATSVGLRSADDDLHLRWKRAHLRAKTRAL